MAVAFVIGNAYTLTTSLVQRGTTISSSLANEFNEAESALYSSSLVTMGLILFLITCIVLGLSRVLLRRLSNQGGYDSKNCSSLGKSHA